MTVSKAYFSFVVVALLGLNSSALKFRSPCPNLFHYDSAAEPNQWSGTLTLLTDSDLHGVWIRLMFNENLKDIKVHDDFGEIVKHEDAPEFLIKNRKFLLKAGIPTDVKITVKYEGDKIPTLTGYRLNARMVCPPQQEHDFGELFSGDLNNQDFLASVGTPQETFPHKELEGCGTTPLLASHDPANKKAQSGQWPWQGAIYIEDNSGEKYVCEATLISSKHVLTSAHCVTYRRSEFTVPEAKVSVHLGSNKFARDGNTQKFGAESIVLNPGYRAKNLFNDLAIIQLDRAVIIGDYVRPICLKQSASSKGGFLVGYGISENKFEDLSQAGVNILDEKECAKKSPELQSKIGDNVFCASYVADDTTCVGDSGSSVVVLRKDKTPVWELKGVLSVGVALRNKSICDRSSVVLAEDVARYLRWIDSVLL